MASRATDFPVLLALGLSTPTVIRGMLPDVDARMNAYNLLMAGLLELEDTGLAIELADEIVKAASNIMLSIASPEIPPRARAALLDTVKEKVMSVIRKSLH